MLFTWVLPVLLYSTLTNAAVTCDFSLGAAISGFDCDLAMDILITRVQNSQFFPPYRRISPDGPETFVLHSHGAPTNSMPQGAQFGSCGVGIDIAPDRTAAASWPNIVTHYRQLRDACPKGGSDPARPGPGGILNSGSFTFMIVDPGRGMHNLIGTCMTPNPPHALPLFWQLRERLCGFDSISALLQRPDTSQLPASPAILPQRSPYHPGSFSFQSSGQWLWNADAWSPIASAVFTRRKHTTVWVLLTGATSQPAPFSRTIPLAIGTAWFQPPHGPQELSQSPIYLLGAWGARGSSWTGLTGDCTNMQSLLRRFDWILIKQGNPSSAGGTTAPASQQAPTGNMQSRPGRSRVLFPLPIPNPPTGNMQSPAGQSREASGAGSDNPPISLESDDLDQQSRDDGPFGSEQAAGSDQGVGLDQPAGSDQAAGSTPPPPLSNPPESSTASEDDGARPSKRPRPNS